MKLRSDPRLLLFALALLSAGFAPTPPAAPAAKSSAPATPAPTTPATSRVPASSGRVRPSAGCQSYTITMGTQQLTLDLDGVKRRASMVVPQGARPQAPLPLVFAWHDSGGSGGLARVYFGIEQQALAEAIFIYPEAVAAGNGQRPGWDSRGDGRDLRLFDRLLEMAASQLCVDMSRVFSAGHGAGADLSRVLACQRGPALRGIAGVGGRLASTCAERPRRPGDPAVWAAPAGSDWPPTTGPRIWQFFASLR